VRVPIILIAAFGLFAAVLVWSSRPTLMRYAMTVTVDTPEGPRSGVSVFESRAQRKLLKFEGVQITSHLSGEAGVVDLPGRGRLFALMEGDPDDRGSGMGQLIARTLFPNGPVPTSQRPKLGGPPVLMHRYMQFSENYTGPRMSGYPMLVRFADISQPETVMRVDPDDLTGSFGPGVHLRSITIQITDQPITQKIKQMLPWLAVRNGTIPRGSDWQFRNGRMMSGRELPLYGRLHDGYFYSGAIQ